MSEMVEKVMTAIAASESGYQFSPDTVRRAEMARSAIEAMLGAPDSVFEAVSDEVYEGHVKPDAGIAAVKRVWLLMIEEILK